MRESAVTRMYPGRSGVDVVVDYVRNHPGCTITQIRRGTRLGSPTYLRLAEERGRVIRDASVKPVTWTVTP